MKWFGLSLMVLLLLGWMKIVSGQPNLRSVLALFGRVRWPLAWRTTLEAERRAHESYCAELQAKAHAFVIEVQNDCIRKVEIRREENERRVVEARAQSIAFVAKFAQVVPMCDPASRRYYLTVMLDDSLLSRVAVGMPPDWEFCMDDLLHHVRHELHKLGVYQFQAAAERNAINNLDQQRRKRIPPTRQ